VPNTQKRVQGWTVKLRAWQERALQLFRTHAKPDFLAMATPGAGKTRFALRVAHQLLCDGAIQRIVVVCPTNHLRGQWAEAAHEVGLHLDPNFSTDYSREAYDYQGIVVTFQQVCAEPRAYRAACRLAKTLVVFDEVHHAGEGKQWAMALQQAFDIAVSRLALSGTPFRSDSLPIPFVTYQDSQSVPDFSYGYADSLAEGVCRPIVFPSYEGELAWLSRGQRISATFSDGLKAERRRERLKTALLQSEWLGPVLNDANTELTRLRATEDASAAGLVVTMDQSHAAEVAGQLHSITRKPVRVAVSDDPSASKTIARFRNSRDHWLVAVNMVSEGVDIPRLRVGVYATNVQTEMYFRQVVGRLVRAQPHLPRSQRAYLYIPGDPTLVEYAKAIKAERDHVLDETYQQGPQRTLFGSTGSQGDDYVPLHAIARADVRIGDDNGSVEPCTSPSDPSPRYQHKEQLRLVHKNLVSRLARKTGLEPRAINAELIRRTGNRIDSATVQQLELRIRQLERWLERGTATLR
jgi:superfamily II DNA or RNA helicase